MENSGGLQSWVPARQLPALVALRGPGQLGRQGTEGILIFNAGQAGRSIDLVGQFFADDFAALDWLDDYLQDFATTSLVRNLQSPAEEEDDEEEVYYKNMVTSVELAEYS